MHSILGSALFDSPEDTRIHGVAIAEVISNWDATGLGRVQLRLPWLPSYQPWARVAMLSAGSGRGTFFIPQVGDEVLVAFNQGDVREPYVIGSLWNGRDKPPCTGPLDPVEKRVIRTPAGHQIEFDDTWQSITIETSGGQKIVMEPGKVELTAGGAAKLTLTTSDVTIEGATIQIKASAGVELKATTLDLAADASATLKGSGLCTIQGGLVKIN